MNDKNGGFTYLYLLVGLLVIGLLWTANVQKNKLRFEELRRAEIIEAVLHESFCNGLRCRGIIEKKHREKDRNVSCYVEIESKELKKFIANIEMFKFRPEKEEIWKDFIKRFRKYGIIHPEMDKSTVLFSECEDCENLYNELQSYFAMSKSCRHDFLAK